MPNGRVKKKMDKGFGFIESPEQEKDLFFHASALDGISFDELEEGQAVVFEVGHGDKGPRAENVRAT